MSAQLYDDLDLLYREIWGTSLHHGIWENGRESVEQARSQLIEQVLQLLKPSGTLVDIGCGYGDLALKITRNFPCEVHACTNSKKQADSLPNHPGIHPHHFDWLEHTLPDGSLDQAVAIESLSHFNDFERFVVQTFLALKPGGTLVIADWFSDGSSSRLLRHLAKAGDIPTWRSLKDLEAIASQQGFITITTHDLSRQAAPTWTAMLFKALALPFRRPRTLPTLLRQAARRPSLLWSFPLLRLAYQQNALKYHLIQLKKTDKVSSRPSS
ncbi:methyltransferase domain-containing protein [Verrucomicrobiaceae bacterium 227]